jgi:type II secretory pathway pseudopilin PulG
MKQRSERNGERGFSLVELVIVITIAMIISVMAIINLQPSILNAKCDAAMKQVVDQIRQAREYAIANRRYVQISFPLLGVQPQVVITQMNTLTPGAGLVNPVLSTVTIEGPTTYYVMPGILDTPDAYGNGGAIYFGGVTNGPVGGMLFQSDGELVAAATFLPINGSVFMGIAGTPTTARAISVLGTTGRVHAWKSTGTAGASWNQF